MKGNEAGAEALQKVRNRERSSRFAPSTGPAGEEPVEDTLTENPELEEKLRQRVRVMLQRGV